MKRLNGNPALLNEERSNGEGRKKIMKWLAIFRWGRQGTFLYLKHFHKSCFPGSHVVVVVVVVAAAAAAAVFVFLYAELELNIISVECFIYTHVHLCNAS